MAVRGHNNAAGYCHHWYLTFDGNKCANPDTIETLDYSATTGDNHRAMNSKAALGSDCLLHQLSMCYFMQC